MKVGDLYGKRHADTVVFSFARMQPPTIGHERLVKKVIETAKACNADHVMYLSQRNDKDNPLLWEEKVNIAKTAFSGLTISEDKNIKTPYDALYQLCEKYANVILVVGSDRVDGFQAMNEYVEKYGAKSFQIMECGARDTHAQGVEGVSSTKARYLAIDGNYGSFSKMLPSTLSEDYKKTIFKKIRESNYEHIWYHGSGMDFQKFDTDSERIHGNVSPAGVYLTKEEDIAVGYAERFENGIVYEVEPDVFNPYYPGQSEIKDEMLEAYRKVLRTFPGYDERHIESMVKQFSETGRMKADFPGNVKTQVLQAGGFDSTFFADFGFNSLVVFDADDITILNKYRPQQRKKDPEYDQHIPKKEPPKTKKKKKEPFEPTGVSAVDDISKEFDF